MRGHTTAWQSLPGSGRRVKLGGSILRANKQKYAESVEFHTLDVRIYIFGQMARRKKFEKYGLLTGV